MKVMYYPTAIICATLAVVALQVCSHNHAHAPLVALALATLGGGAFWRHRKLTAI